MSWSEIFAPAVPIMLMRSSLHGIFWTTPLFYIQFFPFLRAYSYCRVDNSWNNSQGIGVVDQVGSSV